jgi:hypothetical protein
VTDRRTCGVVWIPVRVLLLLGLVLVVATGCGGDDDDEPLPFTGASDCFAVWNGPGNEENRARIAGEAEFDVAVVGHFAQISDFGEGADESDVADAEREGCSYLFHTDHRYLTFSGTWAGDELRWDTPATISGPWSPEQDANAEDNAEVAADGTLQKRPPPAPPSEPPPTVGGLEPPPPAWIETSRGRFWLGYSTFCWESGCADFIAPSCSDERDVPKLVVDRGEIVHAHLGFTPRRVSLVEVPGQREIAHRLVPTPEDVVWRVDRAGPFALTATAKRGAGEASYVACIELR